MFIGLHRTSDTGSMQSAIAVCDVSGSMTCRGHSDRSLPLNSSVGLSLLLAEITSPPFSNTLISFSKTLTVVQIDPSLSSVD